MRKSAVISAWLVLFLWLGAGGVFAGESFKALTWNMCWFPGHNPDASAEEKQVQMKRAQAALKKIGPDIFLCQEVASWEAVEEATSVVPGLKPAVVSDFGPAAEGMPPQNVGIATRFPVISGWAESWSKEGGQRDWHLPRGFAFAAIQLPDDMLLLTYTVHLKSNYKESKATPRDDMEMREESSRLLLTHVRRMLANYGKAYSHIGVLIGGDFNTSLDDPRFNHERTLRAFIDKGYDWAFATVPEEERFTIRATRSSSLPSVTFDHFFSLSLGAPVAHVLNVRRVSDHLPVEIVIPTK